MLIDLCHGHIFLKHFNFSHTRTHFSMFSLLISNAHGNIHIRNSDCTHACIHHHSLRSVCGWAGLSIRSKLRSQSSCIGASIVAQYFQCVILLLFTTKCACNYSFKSCVMVSAFKSVQCQLSTLCLLITKKIRFRYNHLPYAATPLF